MTERLSILNDPPTILEGPQLLHKLVPFEKYGDACAIDCTTGDKRQTYTYREIQSCVKSLAAKIQKTLASHKTQADPPVRQHIVPVILPQAPGLYISQLAILESGGAFCPVNLDAPKERIKFVVGDVSANIIISSTEFRDVVSWEGGPAVILVDDFPVIPQEEPMIEWSREVLPRDLAYVMYTSGSSGTPKGVAVSHLAASQSLLAHERLIPPFQRFLQFAAPSFDVSVFEIFFPLTRGCTLVGCHRSRLLNDLPGTINELAVDAAELTPTVVSSLLQKRSNAPGLKLLLTIGEMLTTNIVDEFGGSATSPSILFGMYGPTEATIHCAIHPSMETTAKARNIGVPFDTVSVFIAPASSSTDEDGQIRFLPVGELGELILGGPQLAEGYLNREEQNKSAFVHVGGKGYYRTGDKARILEDGTIEIHGRMTAGQVKLRGQRVELGEIEEAVYKHPGIKTVSAAVLGSVAIVFALADDPDIQQEDILKTCAAGLPKFMLPSEIVLLNTFPYLPSGKVDKHKLKSDYQQQRKSEDSEPGVSLSPTEQLVRETLQDLVGAVPTTTRLAAAGLDSLVAIRVASKLRSSGFNVNTIAVLQADTLSSLVRICNEARHVPSEKVSKRPVATAENALEVLNGNANEIESTMPCTPLQSAMLAESAVDHKAYWNWVALEFPGISDIDAVISALHMLAEHNALLRTGFTESRDSDAYVQLIWRILERSQITKVEEFNYDLSYRTVNLRRPLRIQVRQFNSNTKLLMHIHHALYDAWSLELLLDDLDTLLTGQPLQTRPPFSNIVDGYLEGTLPTDSSSSKVYWADHLSHLDLRQVPNFHVCEVPAGALAVAHLSTSISTSEVEVTARRLGVSPQSLFQAAYALVLSSYLGTSDICFGTVFSGRTLPITGIEDIAGPCLATLPIRVSVSTSGTLQDLVQELNVTNRKHLEHSTIPLQQIKSFAGVGPRQHLFDTLLIWQQTLHSYDHTRKHVSVVDSVDNLEFHLTLEIVPGIGNIELRANYQQSLLPKSQIDILLLQIEQLSRVIIEHESTCLDDVFNHVDYNILSLENALPETELRSGTLSSPVERVAVEDPDRPAIEVAQSIRSDGIEIHRMSYFELNSRANQIGHHLLKLNVVPDELVCICMEKSVDLYASILATAKVGAGYLPVTPDTPVERLQHILHEANVKMLLAFATSRPLLKSLQSVTVVYVDDFDFKSLPSENISPRSTPANLSYCVFTSGSTGTPKGVLVTQENLLSNFDALEDLYPATKESRFLQACSQAFDVSVFEIFFTWRIGGCLCSAAKDVLFQDIENSIRQLGITHLSLTPTVAALIDPENVPKVSFLVTAGEAVTQKVFKGWAGKGLYQGYGPSETTNICTVNPNVSIHDPMNNIGPPLKNTSVFVLSPRADFALVPRGGEGEFCFGGSQVFRGYVNPSQEVGKFIDHPSFGRLYRSGDFGRLMPDGSLAFTGRIDDQVKIRGQRVELGEINNVMLRTTEVSDCVTLVISGTKDDSQRLVCFWTSGSETQTTLECRPPSKATIMKLYRNLESAVPAYMIPSALVPISCLPSTLQGKIDKRLLVTQYHALDVSYLDSCAPVSRVSSDHIWTDLELEIAKALANLTKHPLAEVNPETSFLSFGIDSISAIRFSRLVREATDCQVEISDIFKFPSVVALAERISSGTEDILIQNSALDIEYDFGFDKRFLESTIESFKERGKAVQKILPCTPLQEAMLSAGESSSSSRGLYSNQVLLNIHGSAEKLERCWEEMIRRHEILRTCFVRTEMARYAYAQVVLDSFHLNFGSVYQGTKDVVQIMDELEKRAARGEFEPPYSLDFVHTSNSSTMLLISVHHALYDGVALAVLYEEVENVYHGKSLPPPTSFAPFLKSIASIKTEDSDRFWESTLAGCSPTILERAWPRLSKLQEGQNHTRIQRAVAKCSLSWIEDMTRKYSTSLLAVCQTAWASLLSERLKETDVCFGNVVSCRTVLVKGIERLVAPCFNTIAGRLQEIHKLSYLEAFRTLQDLSANLLPFQSTPLRRIQSKFSPDGSRLFDTLFILQQPSRDVDSSVWSISKESGAMNFPIVCEVVPKHSDDTLEIILHSHSSIFPSEDGLLLLETFDEKLEAALKNPRHQILSAGIKEQIVAKVIRQDKVKSEVRQPAKLSEVMTPDELKLRDVISSFTDVPLEKIGRDVSIFRLGLDSINAVQVAARLRKQGRNVLASDVLEHSSISRLSAHLSLSNDISSQDDADYDFEAFDKEYRELVCTNSGISTEYVESVRPCTPVQKGMLAQSLHSRGQEYVNSMWLELLPDLSLSKFRAAWDAVCEEHEMLRTGFAQTDDAKSPFAMITYKKENFKPPWYEIGHAKCADTIADNLLNPWSLNIIEKSSKIVVLFNAHHALYDAQSMQMILSDVAGAFFSGSVLSRPPVSSLLGAILRDSEDDLEAKKVFWQREENKIIVNRFPDLTPLRVSTGTHSVHELFSEASTVELEGLSRKNGVTMQAAGQVAWARLLAAYVGETATTFGMTLSGRSIHEDADEISFPTIITIPVCCAVTGTNAEVLSRTMSSNASLHRHQFTPLTSIQKWGGFPEGKIFDTLFAYQKLPDAEDSISLPWKVIREEATVNYAVSLEVQPTVSGKVALRLTFKDNLIPMEQAGLILRQYDALLLDTLRNPQNPCDGTPIVGIDLLSITPAKENELPDSVALLHEFVEKSALQWPHKKALAFATRLDGDNVESQSWTYEQLNREANRIANYIVKRRVLVGEIVAICFDKCPEASLAIIGVLKAGCAYVALDPNAPPDRLKFIVEDSGAKLILTAGRAAQNIKESLDSEIIPLDSPKILEDYPSESPKLSRDITSQDFSYCLYTSGTTGTPKGCLLTHENAVQAMKAFQRLFAGHWTEDSKWLQFASFHFDVSVLEHFWSWSVGICVASAPRDLIFEDIPAAIQKLGITHIDLTPSLARLLHPKDVPSLCKGVFITGGEQLKQEILDVWGEHACIYNGYGPTEATIGVTMYPRVPVNGKPSNIGPQFDNVGSFVLQVGTTLPVLRGGVGELCVSGKLVGKGYLNNPALTGEKFPTLENFQERVYRTGDLVRILHNGDFIFIGRADDQVKLRGQRLELREINEVIKKCNGDIEEVVTLVIKHIAQQKEQLVTFFLRSSFADASGDTGIISRIRDACKARLPGYMVPTHFIPIKKLPLNSNNKADSKQLAAIYNGLSVEDLQKMSHSSQQEKRWTAGESKILDIIANALNVSKSTLTPDSNVFELGLDSISIIGFARTLQNSGLGNGKLSVVTSNSTIAKLVSALIKEDASNQERENAYVTASQNIAAFSQRHFIAICRELGIEAKDIENIAPCTPVQEGMIYRFLESENALYFHEFKFRLHDGVDPGRLLDAWRRVIARLQILRTKFVTTDDGYAQVVLRSLDVAWERQFIDYSAIDKSLALKKPYKLGLRSNSNENFMSLHIFHGIYDGNSLTMLLRRVIDEYSGLDSIEYGPSFHSSLAFGPLAQVPGAERFWANHLKDWSHHQMAKNSSSMKDIVAIRVLDSLDGFEDLRRRIGVTPQSMIQAIWTSVVQTIISPDLTIGIVTSGRAIDFDGANNVIGPLFNVVPFHVKIQPGLSFVSLISLCHNFIMQLQDFQHTPLKDIQKWSPAKPVQPLFSTLFVFQRPDFDDGELEKDIWTQMDDEQNADYRIALEATLSPDNSKLTLSIVAQGAVISQDEANNLLDQMEETLNSALQQSGNNNVLRYEGISYGNETSHDLKDSTILDLRAPLGTVLQEHGSKPFKWTPQTEKMRTEIAILANISEDEVNEHSSIFELGLDSIDVIKLSSRLRKLGIQIAVSAIIKCQTIAKMVAGVSAESSQVSSTSLGKTIREMSQNLFEYLKKTHKLPQSALDVLPATPLQQSMLNEMINSSYQRYFNIQAYKLNEDVDLEQLIAAVGLVVDHSPILRTSFIEIDDPRSSVSYAQIVHRKALDDSSNSTCILASDDSFGSSMDRFRATSTGLAASSQALFQVRYLLAGQTRYMVMAISHALYDGRSLQALHDDIFDAYHEKFSPRLDSVPFLDHVLRSAGKDSIAFWRSTLSNLPPARFPTKMESEIVDLNSIYRSDRVSRIPLKDVEALCKSLKITLQTVGQTCWALVLSNLMGHLDVVFGTVLSCRDSEEADKVMFPLMNTVAVRSILHGSLSEMLVYMQEMSDDTRQYQHFPLGKAQALALASRDHSISTKNTSLFDTLFVYQGRRPPAQLEPLYESTYGVSEVEFPVCVEMEILNDQYISWTTACKSIARTAEESEQIITALEIVLESIISEPQAPTFVSDSEGISVCGLPKFRKAEESPKNTPNVDIRSATEEWSETELIIRKALHEVSNVPEDMIRKEATIFHLGLDSILVLKLPSLLKCSGITLRVNDILRDQTISAMAQTCLRANVEQQDPIDVDSILKNSISSSNISSELQSLINSIGEVQYAMPATAGQLYMIRRWQISRGALFYPRFTYALPSPIDKAKLEIAWRRLLQQHDILRTGFVNIGSHVWQVVIKEPPNKVVYPCKGEIDSSLIVRPESTDLRNPPVTLEVEESAESMTTLKLIIHHALYDGISIQIILDQLQSLYQSCGTLPTPRLSFGTFVAQCISSSKTPAAPSTNSTITLMKQKWISYLQHDSLLTTPIIDDCFTTSGAKGTEVFYPSMKVKPMKKFAQETGVSIDALFLAAMAKTYAGECLTIQGPGDSVHNIAFGIYLANRAPFGEDLSLLAAPTLNLLPLVVRDPLGRNLSGIAKNIQEDLHNIGSAEMSCASLEEIYEWAGVRVNFFVNILKAAPTEENSLANSRAVEDSNCNFFQPVQDLTKRAEVVDYDELDNVSPPPEGAGDAYLPSIDVEIRYHGDVVDMGVFGPTAMISTEEAERMIRNFVQFWN